jgi:hypothetical protein
MTMQSQLARCQGEAQELQRQLQDKVMKTSQFVSMKNMVAKKNEQIKKLRSHLEKCEQRTLALTREGWVGGTMETLRVRTSVNCDYLLLLLRYPVSNKHVCIKKTINAIRNTRPLRLRQLPVRRWHAFFPAHLGHPVDDLLQLISLVFLLHEAFHFGHSGVIKLEGGHYFLK